jgi:hypothetical protein
MKTPRYTPTATAFFVPFLLITDINLTAATRYVWQDSPSPAPPYMNWSTAAHIIQGAVGAAPAGESGGQAKQQGANNERQTEKHENGWREMQSKT